MRELDWWDQTTTSNGLKITFVPAQHTSARGLFDRHRSLWGGYVIENQGRRIYFSGDTGYSTHFFDIKVRLGSPDIAMLAIGAYEPRWFMQPIHMTRPKPYAPTLTLPPSTASECILGRFT